MDFRVFLNFPFGSWEGPRGAFFGLEVFLKLRRDLVFGFDWLEWPKRFQGDFREGFGEESGKSQINEGRASCG